MSFNFKAFIPSTPQKPGIYKMFNKKNIIIYVGKAKNLKKRISQYFSNKQLDNKTINLRGNIYKIEITITNNETESLILEQQLIKKYSPKYNILLTDDKSYIYLKINTQQNKAFPSLRPYRDNTSKKSKKDTYFGPYPSAGNMKTVLNLIQKTFKIRNCSESFFKNRTRPCLQYQIHRCSAPCTEYISKEDYKDAINSAKLLLTGKTQDLKKQLSEQMQIASDNLNYEKAMQYRDQIKAIEKTTQSQTIESTSTPALSLDIFAIRTINNSTCIYLMQIRHGHLSNNKTFLLKNPNQSSKDNMPDNMPDKMTDNMTDKILETFFSQNYLLKQKDNIPTSILSYPTPSQDQLALFQQALDKQNLPKIKWLTKPKAQNKARLESSIENAEYHLSKNIDDQQTKAAILQDLTTLIQLDPKNPITKIACFDISHHHGSQTVASCVYFNQFGPVKAAYRHFNIKHAKACDDYGAMREVITRYLTRIIKEDKKNTPDLLLIDGGKGQLTQAMHVIDKLNIKNISAIGIAKGPMRKAGLEKIFIPNKSEPIIIPKDSNILHLLQYIRDESHRFAIKHHRAKKAKATKTSILENIPGIGKAKAKALLEKFGGLSQIKTASTEQLTKIPGIKKDLAIKITTYLN
jgi:excinuclease ABC subunit C